MNTTEHIDDRDVQRAVSQELQWTPGLDDAAIGVAVTDGAVALSGEVNSYSERLTVKHAALRVRGVSRRSRRHDRAPDGRRADHRHRCG